jgi:DNA-directed RNA polymerase
MYLHPIEDYERQLELEKEAIDMGRKQYLENKGKTQESDLPPAQKIMNDSVILLTESISDWIVSVKVGRANRNASQVRLLESFSGDYETVAYIATRECINHLIRDITLTRLGSIIGKKLEQHLTYEKLREEHYGLHFKLTKQLRHTNSERHRRRVVMHTINKSGLTEVKWNARDRDSVGIRLVYLFSKCSNLIEIKRQRNFKKGARKFRSSYIVAPTDATVEYLEEGHEKFSLMTPTHMPMLIPPREWTSSSGGGYLNHDAFKLKLVKGSNYNYMEEIDNTDMPEVYSAINAIQQTEWRINKSVYKVMKQVWEEGGTLGKLPSREKKPLPTCPQNPQENPEKFKNWKREAAKIYEENIRTVSKRIGMGNKLWLSQKFLDEERFYFVWTMDWRQRAYPLANMVNPQADDSGRALLQFSNGKKLGEDGVYWLAIHIAGLFGIDKCSFDERVKWVYDNNELLLDSGMNPMDGERFWSTAKKPYRALSACFEWLGASIAGEDFVSHLPIDSDGSCNGIQNFSAMLLDEIGGKAVNLVPADKPQDIYTEVQMAVTNKLKNMKDEDFAKVWEDRVSRDIVKRPCMTLAYGSSRYGMCNQILEEIKKYKADEGINYLPDYVDENKACEFLSNIVYDTIGDVVVAARKAMDWLQEVAKVASEHQLPIRWETAVGFPVSQAYYDNVSKRLQLNFGKQKFRLRYNQQSSKLSKRKQISGISANYVHSMDAAHMMSTVNMCMVNDIEDLAMVHDSFGTHACNCTSLYNILRYTFVKQYSVDRLELFREQILEQLPDELGVKIPPVPQKGKLDISTVMESEYFFA